MREMKEEYKNWKDLNFLELVKVLGAYKNTGQKDKNNPREEDVKDYYEDNTEKFKFAFCEHKRDTGEMIKYCCRRGKCVEVRDNKKLGDGGHVLTYKPKEGIQLFPECKDCGYGRFYTDYKGGHFIDKAWKSCLLKRREVAISVLESGGDLEMWKKRYEKLLELIDGVEYSAQQWQEIVEKHLKKEEGK